MSNRLGDIYVYEVVICIGMCRYVGIIVNVVMILIGEKGESYVFLFKSSYWVILVWGCIDLFFLMILEIFGEFLYIWMWYDNFGKDLVWFVK